MLSRKYYKMIAQCIKDSSDSAVSDYVGKGMINKEDLVQDLCNEFKADNGMFSRDRFEDACD